MENRIQASAAAAGVVAFGVVAAAFEVTADRTA